MLPEGVDPVLFLLACLGGFAAGFMKGAVGFGMPLVLVSVLSSLLPVHVAIGVVIGPILVTNFQQAFRQGAAEAWASTRRHGDFLLASLVATAVVAPFVAGLSAQALFVVLGGVILLLSAVQLVGWQPEIPARWGRWPAWAVGGVAGGCGGIAGISGPATVLYLLAVRAEKRDAVRFMSVVFALGGVVLAVVHLRSGLFNTQTGLMSALIIPPILVGMAAGTRMQDRLDAAQFRMVSLVLLCLIALNLLRRGVMG